VNTATPTSGTQHEIAFGDYRAVIASIGSSLRVLQHKGRDLVVPFEAEQMHVQYRGVTLAPWPNRIADGKYSFEGSDYQVALTEPERGNALHGLAGWLDFQEIDSSESHVVLAAEIVPQFGYPFRLLLRVRWELTADGLETTVTASNTGTGAAPYGTGPHPYLVAGEGRVDDWVLDLPVAEVMTVTEDRLIPTGVEDVVSHADGAFDFRTPRAIGDVFIDHAFTSIIPNDDGRAVVRVTTADGSGVEMEWGDELPWVQVHTADQPNPDIHRIGLAVEPMTCPPDAFNSGVDLIVLQPGESSTAAWTIRAVNPEF